MKNNFLVIGLFIIYSCICIDINAQDNRTYSIEQIAIPLDGDSMGIINQLRFKSSIRKGNGFIQLSTANNHKNWEGDFKSFAGFQVNAELANAITQSNTVLTIQVQNGNSNWKILNKPMIKYENIPNLETRLELKRQLGMPNCFYYLSKDGSRVLVFTLDSMTYIKSPITSKTNSYWTRVDSLSVWNYVRSNSILASKEFSAKILKAMILEDYPDLPKKTESDQKLVAELYSSKAILHNPTYAELTKGDKLANLKMLYYGIPAPNDYLIFAKNTYMALYNFNTPDSAFLARTIPALASVKQMVNFVFVDKMGNRFSGFLFDGRPSSLTQSKEFLADYEDRIREVMTMVSFNQ